MNSEPEYIFVDDETRIEPADNNVAHMSYKVRLVVIDAKSGKRYETFTILYNVCFEEEITPSMMEAVKRIVIDTIPKMKDKDVFTIENYANMVL